MAGAVESPDVVHCHTWYSHFAGCLARPLTGAPLVLTTHSLEPHRPWKVEQLGSAYHASTWIERTAYENADGVVAVSEAMKHDVQTLYGVAPERVRVIHNGIDPEEYQPRPAPATLRRLGVDPDVPIVLFVGRITRQKGILHLVRAIKYLRPGMQVVLCAGAPDTAEIAAEMTALVAEAKAHGERVVFTNGCFDILHAGHVSYLEEAKSCGDRLVVAVNDDDSVRRLKGAGRPINALADRMAVLAGLAAVDWVVPFGEDTPAELVGKVLPDVLVKGGDYRVDQIAGGDTVLKHGGEVRVLGFKPGRSTSALIDAVRKPDR